jgi:hypothetical protein
MRGLPNKRKISSALYLMLTLGIPFFFFAAGFFAANTEWFFYHNGYFGLRNMGYSLTLHHADCQVVLTGDSSALTGLDPLTITRITGLSACNVAEGGTVTVVTGNYPLDMYLHQNAAPKYIVFMFTPSLFRHNRSWQDYGTYYEGIAYLLRYERNGNTYRQLLKHPYETINFSAWAAHGIVSDAISRLVEPHKYDGMEDPATRRQSHKGLFTLYSAPEISCYRSGWDKIPRIIADPEWVNGIRRQYGINGTHVIVNVAPVADCDDMKDVYLRDLKGLHDNSLEVIPIGMFNSQDVHFTSEGAEHVSTGVANQILLDERNGRP